MSPLFFFHFSNMHCLEIIKKNLLFPLLKWIAFFIMLYLLHHADTHSEKSGCPWHLVTIRERVWPTLAVIHFYIKNRHLTFSKNKFISTVDIKKTISHYWFHLNKVNMFTANINAWSGVTQVHNIFTKATRNERLTSGIIHLPHVTT